MKKLIVILFISVFAFNAKAQQEHPYIKDCNITMEYGFMTKTVSLWGNVKVVTNPRDADFRVKIEKSCGAAAVYVVKVTDEPSQCGEWRFVDSKKDALFTICFVKESEHFSICFTSTFPGSRY
jgi:hypothetical protein